MVIVYVNAVFDSGKAYGIALSKNTIMHQKLLVTFKLSTVTTFLLKTY